MGGGVAGAELAAAVSEAGGLGTIGILPAPLLQRALARARKLTAQPIAVNLLLPFTRPEHWALAGQADVVVTFWGAPVRRTSKPWIHQCGSVAEAHAAQVAGADAVITQGVQAGGHVRGTLPALRLLEQVRAALPGFPYCWPAAWPMPATSGRRSMPARPAWCPARAGRSWPGPRNSSAVRSAPGSR
jgi:NAD(P)H-dependent flavin oxidoreductase YrpB (nitropropane dioxygenase family)